MFGLKFFYSFKTNFTRLLDSNYYIPIALVAITKKQSLITVYTKHTKSVLCQAKAQNQLLCCITITLFPKLQCKVFLLNYIKQYVTQRIAKPYA